jgi:hypothetical protein
MSGLELAFALHISVFDPKNQSNHAAYRRRFERIAQLVERQREREQK